MTRGTIKTEIVERMKTRKFPTNSTATTEVCLGSSLYHLVVWTVSIRRSEYKRWSSP